MRKLRFTGYLFKQFNDEAEIQTKVFTVAHCPSLKEFYFADRDIDRERCLSENLGFFSMSSPKTKTNVLLLLLSPIVHST